MPGRSYSNGNEYRYGFNGHEKSVEISEGSMTSQFWEYDSKIGKRWNLDPKPIIGISSYSVFKGNPLFYKDVLGDTTYQFSKKGKYIGAVDLDIKGIKGSIGEYKTLKDVNGKEFQGWTSSNSFTFNDPIADRKQLNTFKEGDQVLQIVEDGNINDIMKQSDIKARNIFSRFSFANKESSGGKMDFGLRYLQGVAGGGENDLLGGFFIFGSQHKAYNAMDGGNWLWGHAMNKLGFDYSTAKFGSEANEWFRDSPGDQISIKSGFHYSTAIKTIVPFKPTGTQKNTP